ncbi:MAG: hypothetical protein KJO07_09925, partial [Deltaproteobacteria bacterium]|nr:hypothetical protein [Deltaproteobacteria bacterium]
MGKSELSLVKAREDRLGTIVEHYQQTRYGLEVVGGDLRISRSIDGDILSASTAGWDLDASLPATAVSEPTARDAAMALTDGAITVSAGELVYVAPSTGASPILSWQFRVEGEHDDGMPIVDDVFIDALSGELADRHPHVHSARNRLTYDAGNLEDQLGTLVRSEGQGPT